ncbi:MAG: hypothetical protein QM500_17500 [Methylococcales bacterium]
MNSETITDDRMMSRNGVYDIRVVLDITDKAISMVHSAFPGLVTYRINFTRPDRGFFLEPHYIDNIELSFENGVEFVMDGIYLCKFLNMVPKNLAMENDKFEYSDHNPYSDTYTAEEMAKVVRNSFFALTKKHDINEETKALSKVELIFKEDSCQVIESKIADIESEIKIKLTEAFNDYLLLTKSNHDTLVSQWVKQSLLKPKVVNEHVWEGEYLRNAFKEIERGDVSLMLFKEFLTELDADRKGAPFYTPFRSRFNGLSRDVSIEAMNNVLNSFKSYDDELFDYVNEFVTLDKGDSSTLKGVSAHLIDHPLLDFSSILRSAWRKSYNEMKITDIIKICDV